MTLTHQSIPFPFFNPHIMYLFNMLLHYIICYYYYEIGNKLSYPIPIPPFSHIYILVISVHPPPSPPPPPALIYIFLSYLLTSGCTFFSSAMICCYDLDTCLTNQSTPPPPPPAPIYIFLSDLLTCGCTSFSSATICCFITTGAWGSLSQDVKYSRSAGDTLHVEASSFIKLLNSFFKT